MRWGRAARGPSRRPLLLAAVTTLATVVTTTGCVGAIDRDEFDAELRSRVLAAGAAAPEGGVTPAGGPSPDGPLGAAGSFPQVAIAEVLERTGGADLEVTQMTFNFDELFATIEARNPTAPAEFDMYVFVDARLQGSEPVQRTSGDRLEERLFAVSSIPFDRLDDMAATALDELGAPDGRITSITWASVIPGQVDVVVGVESERSRETVRFALDGELVRGLS